MARKKRSVADEVAAEETVEEQLDRHDEELDACAEEMIAEKPRTIPKAVKKYLPTVLTEDERLHVADELASKLADRDDLENQKKNVVQDFKSRIDGISAEIQTMQREIATRQRWSNVECSEVIDFENAEFRVTRLDTHEVIESRPLTQSERQMEI